MVDVSDNANKAKLTDVKIGLFMGAASLVLSSLVLVNIADAGRRLLSSRMFLEQHGNAFALGLICVFTSFMLIVLTIDQVFKRTTSRFLQFVACLFTGSLLLYLGWVVLSVAGKVNG